jgi:hypothetical protein
MGYLVESSGRLLLPQPLEPQVLTVLEVELQRHQGWFHQDEIEAVDTLADLARFVGADLTRDGDWLVVATDEEGDPKWSEQATAFYAGLARWVLQGEVRFEGEDGSQWSYGYTPDGMVQEGVNGWDGSSGAAPAHVAAVAGPPQAPSTPDLRSSPSPGPSPSPPPPSPPTPLPTPPPEPDAWGEPSPAQDFWADDPAPRGGNRTVAMTALLVVGLILIIGVAFLAAGVVG